MPITTFITRLEPGPDDGPVLAVKDIIDVAGVPTTAGSRAVADGVAPSVPTPSTTIYLRAQASQVATVDPVLAATANPQNPSDVGVSNHRQPSSRGRMLRGTRCTATIPTSNRASPRTSRPERS